MATRIGLQHPARTNLLRPRCFWMRAASPAAGSRSFPPTGAGAGKSRACPVRLPATPRRGARCRTGFSRLPRAEAGRCGRWAPPTRGGPHSPPGKRRTRRAPPLGGTARPRAVLVRAEVTYPSSFHRTVRCWGGMTDNCRGAGRCRRGHGNFPEQRVAVVSEDTQERASSNAILEATRNQPTHQLTYPVAS